MDTHADLVGLQRGGREVPQEQGLGQLGAQSRSVAPGTTQRGQAQGADPPRRRRRHSAPRAAFRAPPRCRRAGAGRGRALGGPGPGLRASRASDGGAGPGVAAAALRWPPLRLAARSHWAPARSSPARSPVGWAVTKMGLARCVRREPLN